MNEAEMKARLRQFSLRIIRLVAELMQGSDPACRPIGGQLIRSGTSVGANYRAACRARSKPEFLSKLGIAEEEADESGYWMELIIDAELLEPSRVRPLLRESEEIVAILCSSRKTASRSTEGQGPLRVPPIKNQKSKIKNHPRDLSP